MAASSPLSPKRVHMMDELRGVLILLVALYHLLYDLAVLFPVGIPWMFDPWMNNLRNLCTGTLIFISGISCLYSRSNLRRGLKTFLWGMALTVGTFLVMPSQLILFGILHFFGVSMMLYPLLRPLLDKIPTGIGMWSCVALYFLTFHVYSGVFGLPALGLSVPMPDFLYGHPLLFFVGFPAEGLSSADYYPLIPWIFLFLAGTFCGRWLRAGKFPDFVYQSHNPQLAFIGRHTLLIYLVHQPLSYGLLTLTFFLVSGR